MRLKMNVPDVCCGPQCPNPKLEGDGGTKATPAVANPVLLGSEYSWVLTRNRCCGADFCSGMKKSILNRQNQSIEV